MTLKENYSIPERCLGMRDMLKKFKGKGGCFCASSWHIWALVSPSTLGHREGFPASFVQLLPVCALMSSGWFHGGKTFVVVLDGL